MADERVDQRALGVAGRRMDDEPRRLVDDDQMLVLVDDVERQVLAEERGILRRRRVEGDSRALRQAASPDRAQSRRRRRPRRPRSTPSCGCATARFAARLRPGPESGRAARRLRQRRRRTPAVLTAERSGSTGPAAFRPAGAGSALGLGVHARSRRRLRPPGHGRGGDQRAERGDDRLDGRAGAGSMRVEAAPHRRHMGGLVAAAAADDARAAVDGEPGVSPPSARACRNNGFRPHATAARRRSPWRSAWPRDRPRSWRGSRPAGRKRRRRNSRHRRAA